MTETINDEISLEEALNTNLDIAAPVSLACCEQLQSLLCVVPFCRQLLLIQVEYRVSMP